MTTRTTIVSPQAVHDQPAQAGTARLQCRPRRARCRAPAGSRSADGATIAGVICRPTPAAHRPKRRATWTDLLAHPHRTVANNNATRPGVDGLPASARSSRPPTAAGAPTSAGSPASGAWRQRRQQLEGFHTTIVAAGQCRRVFTDRRPGSWAVITPAALADAGSEVVPSALARWAGRKLA